MVDTKNIADEFSIGQKVKFKFNDTDVNVFRGVIIRKDTNGAVIDTAEGETREIAYEMLQPA